MVLVAIVGMTGSGKSELTSLFEKEGFLKIRFGDITDEVLKKRDLKVNEKNERYIREKIREENGMAAYAILNEPKIRKAIETSDVILDGLYSWEEYLFLKEKFDQLVVLAVYTQPQVRYKRLNKRKIRPLTTEEASSRDKSEIENLNKAAPIVMADYTILNTESLEDLKNKYIKFMGWLNEQKTKMG
ncbi:MAG: AAA family ATPase [Nanoarchaeota archaeon]